MNKAEQNKIIKLIESELQEKFRENKIEKDDILIILAGVCDKIVKKLKVHPNDFIDIYETKTRYFQ